MYTNLLSSKRAAELLSELVSCPSVNPGAANPVGDSSIYGEQRYMQLLGEKLQALGGELTIESFDEKRTNMVCRFAGADRSRCVAFESHGDTVSHEGMTVEPFEPLYKDGLLYGRGACDTKASMAAMIMAIEYIAASGQQLPVDICIASTGDEEISGRGVRALLDSGFKADAVIVGEPTMLDIVCASKGSMRFYIETIGRASHSSAPENGVNAIYHMAKLVDAIENRIAASLAKLSDPQLGSPTISVGKITGGSQVNIVADSCRLEVDRRLVPSETAEAAHQQIVDELERLKTTVADFEYKLKSRSAYPPFATATDHSLVELVLSCCTKAAASKLTSVAWASTAGVFAAAGIPAVIIGPGDIAQAHTADEHIQIDQVLKAAEIYANIMLSADQLAQ